MALPFLKPKKEISLGVDIGTSSIKIVEFSGRSGSKIELTNYGAFWANADRAIYSSSAKISTKETADVIKKIISEARFEGTKAAMSVPMLSGFSTVISLPRMSEAELDQAVIYEAKKYIPLPLPEVKFEWVKITDEKSRPSNVLGREEQVNTINQDNSSASAKETRVLIVAVTNELISKYSQIAALSGLELAYMEIDTFSLARSLVANVNKTVLIVDIGSRNTIITIVENEWPVFTRTMDISGFDFSKVLSSSLGIDFNRAEELKKKNGINAGGDVLIPFIDKIFIEARRIIDNYKSTKGLIVEQVILSGGGSRMFGLVEYAEKSIGKNVVVGSPFRDIIYPGELDKTLQDLAPSFSVAAGLALRAFK